MELAVPRNRKGIMPSVTVAFGLLLHRNRCYWACLLDLLFTIRRERLRVASET